MDRSPDLLTTDLPPGALLEVEARAIINAMAYVRDLDGVYVEVGSDLGRSSVLIGREVRKDDARLYCVDVWSSGEMAQILDEIGEARRRYPERDKDSLQKFLENMTRYGLESVVIPVAMRSDSAQMTWNKPIKFIFIDACHEYEFVKKDIDWKRFIVPGGVMVFHDYNDDWPGVRRAVDELMQTNSDFVQIDGGGSCIAFRKVLDTQGQLVSVIIPTHNRCELLVTRAIPSVLNQTHKNLELIIVADRCTDNTRDRVQKIDDPRIKFIELADRPPLPEDLHDRWRVASAAPRNKGLEMVKGAWICFLDDDDEFTPNHIEVLLQRALMGYDFVYGKLLAKRPDGEQTIIGKYPPEHAHIGAASFIYSSKYRNIKCNVDAAATWEPGDWNLCRRIIEAGAKIFFIDEIVYIHYMPIRGWEREEEMLEWTGERFLPWIEGAQIHYEHLHRYAFAAQLVKGKRVLDLASGEGYGTCMLSKEAEHVVGVDIDEQTVNHARSKYLRDNLEFIQGSILEIPIEGEKKFDVAVCFEGIEHIEEHDKLLSEVKRLLKDDGLFIVSTPNKTTYTDEPQSHNPFHVKELYFDELKGLLSRCFKNVHLLGQRVYTGSNLWDISSKEYVTSDEFVLERGDREFHFSGSDKKIPIYFIALASDSDLEPYIYNKSSYLIDVSDVLIKDYGRQIAELGSTLQAKDAQIQQIQIVMRLLSKYQKVTEKLLRPGTRRRYYYELGLAAIRIILNEGWGSFWFKFRRWLKHK